MVGVNFVRVFEAEKIIDRYIKALATDGGIVRPLSLLMNSSKQLVLDAYKIYMAYMIKHPILEKKQFKRLMSCLLFLNQFVPDKQAIKINKIYKKQQQNKRITSSEHKYFDDFMKKYVKDQADSFRLHNEVVEYINTLNSLDQDSPYYCITAYRLAGVEYKPEYEFDF
mgnify:CR=1 FL=1